MNSESNTTASARFAVLSRDSAPFTFLYFALDDGRFVGYLTNNATGAAYHRTSLPQTFDEIRYASCRPDRCRRASSDRRDRWSEQIQTLQRQIQNLRRTRDLLLPRLLSGQVELSATEQHGVMAMKEKNLSQNPLQP